MPITAIPLERLEIETMASGNMALSLTDQIGWEEFLRYAETVVAWLGGAITERTDGPDERVWSATIQGQRFWIALDMCGASIDSQDAAASALIPELRDALLSRRKAG